MNISFLARSTGQSFDPNSENQELVLWRVLQTAVARYFGALKIRGPLAVAQFARPPLIRHCGCACTFETFGNRRFYFKRIMVNLHTFPMPVICKRSTNLFPGYALVFLRCESKTAVWYERIKIAFYTRVLKLCLSKMQRGTKVLISVSEIWRNSIFLVQHLAAWQLLLEHSMPTMTSITSVFAYA